MNHSNDRRRPRRIAWRTCVSLAVAMVALSLSPWVLAPGRTEPVVLGLPRALWAGLAIALVLVVLTLVGALVHPGGDAEGD